MVNYSELMESKKPKLLINDYVFPEEYFKAMPVGEWVKTVS